LYAYDLETGNTIQTIGTPYGSVGALSSDGMKFYAVFYDATYAGEFREYGVISGRLTDSPLVIPGVGQAAHGIHVSKDGRIWVSSQNSYQVSVIDDGAVVQTVPLDFKPIYGMTSDDNNVYIGGFGVLAVVRASDGTVLKVVDFPTTGAAWTLLLHQGLLYAPFGGSGHDSGIYTYDPVTDAIGRIEGPVAAAGVVTDGCSVYANQLIADPVTTDEYFKMARVWKIQRRQVVEESIVSTPTSQRFYSDGLAIRNGALLVPDRYAEELHLVNVNTMVVSGPLNLPVGGAAFGAQTVQPGTMPLSPPVADAGLDQTIVVGSIIQLAGIGCDPNGDSLNLDWSFIEQPPGSMAVLDDPMIATPTFFADLPGGYEVEFKVDAAGDIDRDTVAITAILPEEAIDNLVEDVETLIEDGNLKSGPGGALITKLEATLASLDGGNTQSAFNQLEAFINQVAALVNSEALSESVGAALIEAARAIQAAL
jgi:hypothetical protein